MTHDFIINTEDVNEYKFRVLTDGIDYTQYMKNPIVLFMHEREFAKTDENKGNYWDVASRNLLEMIFIINKKFNILENEFKRINKEFTLPYEVKQTSYESIYNQISSVEETKNFFEKKGKIQLF